MSSLYYGSNRVLDGSRCVIHAQLTRPAMDAQLWDVRRNRKFNKLYLTGAIGVQEYQQQAPLYLDRDFATALGDLFRNDTRIWERIELEHCEGEIDLIVGAGMSTGRVQSFWFSEMELGTASLHSLSTDLKYNQLAYGLRFKRCRLSAAIEVIADALRDNSAIQSITFEQCGIADAQLAMFVGCARHCSSLQKLSLEGNICRTAGAIELGLLIKELAIQNISLHNQRVEGEQRLEVAPIASSLRGDRCTLKFLDLSRNCLKDEDVRLLMEALVDSNRSLETLHLDQNDITDVGAGHIANALSNLAALKTLALPENPVGATGAGLILNALPENYTIETFIVPYGISQIQRKIRWYGNLNRGGRRLFTTPHDVPLSVFPLAFQRVNHLPLSHDWNPEITPSDVIYGLLRLGQLLFEIEDDDRWKNLRCS